MNLLEKFYYGIVFVIATVVAKLHYYGELHVEGLFRKRIDTQIRVFDGGKIDIGKNVKFYRNVSISSICGGMLTIGNDVFFNRNCIIMCRKKIIIKDNVLFGPGVTIYDHDHKFSREGILPGYNLDSIIIEKGCWIASNVTILKGTHIGEYCVIGAGVVVKGNIPSHSLVTCENKLKVVPISNR